MIFVLLQLLFIVLCNPFLITVNTKRVDKTKCDLPKVFNSCGSRCPTTCTKLFQIVPCTRDCVPGCYCPNDSALLSNEQCAAISSSLCQTEARKSIRVDECPPSKVYNECGSACPLACATLNQQIECGEQCVSGCFCPSSQALLQDGTCVDVTSTECLNEATTSCPASTSYQTCGSACPLTCSTLNQQLACNDECIAGCFCSAGQAFLNDGSCVAENSQACQNEAILYRS